MVDPYIADWRAAADAQVRNVARAENKVEAAKIGARKSLSPTVAQKQEHGRFMKWRKAISHKQQEILDVIRARPGIIMADIALAVGIPSDHASQVTQSLRRKGMVRHDGGKPAKWIAEK